MPNLLNGTLLQPCFFGLLIANLFASMLKLKAPERVAVAIECCYQNVGISTSVALTMFEGDELNDAMGVVSEEVVTRTEFAYALGLCFGLLFHR